MSVFNPNASSSLDAFVSSFYAPAQTGDAEQILKAQKATQGSAFDARLDANHPLQSWAKKLTDFIIGDSTNLSGLPTAAQSEQRKWDRWLPVALLAVAVWLLFQES